MIWMIIFRVLCSFTVKCSGNLSSPHLLSLGVPQLQGSVFGPLLFIMYTTPISSLTSSLTINRLYADDTQLFLSFSPAHFCQSILQLQHSGHQISSWISTNLLSLNSSKTEFLLLGLKQQLSKITTTDHSSLTTTTLLAILVLYLMNIFVSRHKSGLSLNHAFPTSVIFVAFDLTSTMKRPASVPALLYTLNLVTVTLCTITFHITR